MIGTFEGPQGSLAFFLEGKRGPSGYKFIDGGSIEDFLKKEEEE